MTRIEASTSTTYINTINIAWLHNTVNKKEEIIDSYSENVVSQIKKQSTNREKTQNSKNEDIL